MIKYDIGGIVGKNGISLIKDLGMGFVTSKSAKRTRLGIFKCPSCKKEFTGNFGEINRGSTKRCKDCNLDRRKISYKVIEQCLRGSTIINLHL